MSINRLGSWSLSTRLEGKAGIEAKIELSPFEAPFEFTQDIRWGPDLALSADLAIGVKGEIGVGLRMLSAEDQEDGGLTATFGFQPFWYASVSAYLVAEASASLGLSVGFSVKKSLVLFVDKDFEPFGPRYYKTFTFTSGSSPTQPLPSGSTTTTTQPLPVGSVTSTTQPVAPSVTTTSSTPNGTPSTTVPATPALFAAVRAGGISYDNIQAVEALNNGAALVAGTFDRSASFGSTTLVSDGCQDAYVGKVSASGSWVWVIRAGGAGCDWASDISALSDGSSIVTGTFRGTANFGGTTLVSEGSSDVYVAKLSSGGSWLWAVSAGASGIESATGVSVLPDGSSVATGMFPGRAVFGSHTITGSANNDDIFVAKVSAAGDWVWALRAGGGDTDYASSVRVAPDGTAYVVGQFGASAAFGTTSLVSGGVSDVFVAKVSVDGGWLWATKAGGSGWDSASSVAILSDGSAMVTGSFNGTASFGSMLLTADYSYDAFVAKISSSGEWARVDTVGGSGSASGLSIATLSDGSSIVTGSFNGTASFGSSLLTAVGFDDAFFAKISSSGEWVWSVSAGGVRGINFAISVSVYADGSAVIGGEFTPQITFGSTVLQSMGSTDVFITKVSSSGAFL